jgi:hypothetical protein
MKAAGVSETSATTRQIKRYDSFGDDNFKSGSAVKAVNFS